MNKTERAELLERALANPYVRAALEGLAYTELGPQAAKAGGWNAGMSGDRVYRKNNGQVATINDKGRYQFSPGTNRDLAQRWGLSGDDPETQNKKAIAIMADAGALHDIMEGDIHKVMDRLGNRWHSLYSSRQGNAAHGTWSPNYFFGAYNQALSQYTNNAADTKYVTLEDGSTPMTVDMSERPTVRDPATGLPRAYSGKQKPTKPVAATQQRFNQTNPPVTLTTPQVPLEPVLGASDLMEMPGTSFDVGMGTLLAGMPEFNPNPYGNLIIQQQSPVDPEQWLGNTLDQYDLEDDEDYLKLMALMRPHADKLLELIDGIKPRDFSLA